VRSSLHMMISSPRNSSCRVSNLFWIAVRIHSVLSSGITCHWR
jgi:hypothetical protein